jgi:hypothetical protein
MTAAGITYNAKVGQLHEVVGVQERIARCNIHVHKPFRHDILESRCGLLSKEQNLEKGHFQVLALACLYVIKEAYDAHEE